MPTVILCGIHVSYCRCAHTQNINTAQCLLFISPAVIYFSIVLFHLNKVLAAVKALKSRDWSLLIAAHVDISYIEMLDVTLIVARYHLRKLKLRVS